MRILLDTNILLSAALFPNGVAAQAYLKAVSYPHSSIVCEYSIDELRRVFNRKFPARLPALDRFLSISTTAFTIIPTPAEVVSDRPLIRAAQLANVDILLTGDKDFLESEVENPMILSPSQFLNY